MDSTVQRAYAKINLHLDVTSRMENGFHSVTTVMQTVSLCDTLTLSLRDDREIFISCDKSFVPTGEKNIAWRAADKLLRAAGLDIGVSIHIEKKIPMAAGLAGGSADAAAVLRGLNELCGEPLTLDELCILAGELGSDVPFCVVGGTALATGRGDVLCPFPALPSCTLLVACGGEGVSTPEAYGMLDERFNRFENYSARSLDALEKAIALKDIPAIAASTFNIFEEPILTVRPTARRIKDTMLDCGALGAMMSGSGPSVFGIFEKLEDARAAREQIKDFAAADICEPAFFEKKK